MIFAPFLAARKIMDLSRVTHVSYGLGNKLSME